LRINSSLETIRGFTAQTETTSRVTDSFRYEIRALQKLYGSGVIPYFGIGAAHNPSNRDSAISITNEQIVRYEDALLPSRVRIVCMSRARRTMISAPARKEVESMERLPTLNHHIVSHINEIVDRTNADRL
jgi:hypothetical protein